MGSSSQNQPKKIEDGLGIVEVGKRVKLLKSNGEARRALEQNTFQSIRLVSIKAVSFK